ncbi:MAG: tetratricopeptide repeat protein [Acidobacteriota bacterium]
MRSFLPCCALAAALFWMSASASAQMTTGPDPAEPSSAPASPGDLFAQGYRHLTGQGSERDATRAAAYFLEAARAGEPQSQFQLGILFMDAHGVPRDILWAWYWLDRAARHPDLPDPARELARGRLAALNPLLNADQKRRLGWK